MDADNIDAPRATRARTRRLSALETDSNRPLTPQLDVAPDRASPRLTRRTRLNSATIDVKTPTRATRSATVEPGTPTLSVSAKKRVTRTPAKSAPKQLPLQEEEAEQPAETEEKKNVQVVAQPEPVSKMEAVKEQDEVEQDRSPFTSPSLLQRNVTPTDDMRITRSMSKTPPVVGRSSNNTPPSARRPLHNSPTPIKKSINSGSQSQLQLEKTAVTPEKQMSAEAEDTQITAESTLAEQEATQATAGKPNKENDLQKNNTITSQKLKVKVKDISQQLKESPKKLETSSSNIDMEAEQPALAKVHTISEPETETEAKCEPMPTNDVNTSQAEEEMLGTLEFDASSVENAVVTESIILPTLTPGIKSRVIDTQLEDIYTVRFDNDEVDDIATKQKYPKTPGRIYGVNKGDVESPLKLVLLEGRKSSTPLAKAETSSCKAPLQLDAIQPLSTLANKETDVVRPIKKKLEQRLISSDEDEEEDEHVDKSMLEFVDNEVEVVDNYQSGESMDSSERRELEDNEVPCDGESVGSQDTPDEHGDESDDENLSFIVSDEEVSDDNNESACFSADSLVETDTKGKKKRRRLIVHDTSDEEQEEHPTTAKEEDNKTINKSTHESSPKKTAEKHDIENVKGTLNQSACESENENELNKSDLNKTVAISSESDESFESAAVDTEEVLSSADEYDKKKRSKSVYEIFDSFEEANEENKTEAETETTVATTENQDITMSGLDTEQAKHIPLAEKSIQAIEPNADESELQKMPTSKSSVFHGKQQREDEQAMLADLSHMQQMFNPLQKTRRQTLFGQGLAMAEPKLKRRSEQLSNDFKPSQSFNEMIEERKQQLPKRQRMSKSFCVAAVEDLVEEEGEVSAKKARKSPTSPQTDVGRNEVGKHTDAVLQVESETGDFNQKTESIVTTAAAEEIETIKLQQAAEKTKNRDYYMEYCDTILQAANQAKLEQKKQRAAAGKKTKTQLRVVATPASPVPVAIVAPNQESDKQPKLKKDLKRLQATKQAVKHAMQLLVPDLTKREPQSIARKISPQPPEVIKQNSKVKRQVKKHQKTKIAATSPIKSSDEENKRTVQRVKTSAGYALVTKIAPKKKKNIETFKTKSGIVQVEPCTPKQKYFKEVPSTPKNRWGFQEYPGSPVTRHDTNSATESALQFKRQIFGRKYK
ncbi:protein slender lobes isoform X2 [Drosophila busckii]|uniref:protein slender lobes isoform X2 n=1 Tax=Drosophila busckii TaxID=30019 RepID=UPI00083F2BB4|nr:protein slender lobes isoform X2 [Drosophila busckii]